MFVEKRKHKFEAPAGARLCTWCGHLQENNSYHFSAPNGWEPIETAPQNATNIEVILPSNERVIAHWAQDLSGEDRPPFRGWFKERKDRNGKHLDFIQIDNPLGWRPLKESVK